MGKSRSLMVDVEYEYDFLFFAVAPGLRRNLAQYYVGCSIIIHNVLHFIFISVVDL